MRRVLWVGLSCLLWLGCAGGPHHRGPVVSPTGIVYPPGTPPQTTRYSQTATLYLRSAEPARAAELASEGMAQDPENPIHYFLGAVASSRLGDYARADSLFILAERIYPAYQLEIEPERLAAWAEAFNRGSDAYADGLDDRAIELWRGAALMYDLRPEAHRNLAMVLAQAGRLDEATEIYAALLDAFGRVPATRILTDDERRARDAERHDVERRLADIFLMSRRLDEASDMFRRILARDQGDVHARQSLALALHEQGDVDAARELYGDLLSERDLSHEQLHDLGLALFRADAPDYAAEAFRRVTDVWPASRDAWFNYANALFAAEDWHSLVLSGAHLLGLDPLGESAALLIARAHLELGDQGAALRELDRIDTAPVHIERLSLQVSGSSSVLRGDVRGNDAEPGTHLSLQFVFYGEGNEIARDTVLVAPAPGETTIFRLVVETRAAAYRYVLTGVTPPSRFR